MTVFVFTSFHWSNYVLFPSYFLLPSQFTMFPLYSEHIMIPIFPNNLSWLVIKGNRTNLFFLILVYKLPLTMKISSHYYFKFLWQFSLFICLSFVAKSLFYLIPSFMKYHSSLRLQSIYQTRWHKLIQASILMKTEGKV